MFLLRLSFSRLKAGFDEMSGGGGLVWGGGDWGGFVVTKGVGKGSMNVSVVRDGRIGRKLSEQREALEETRGGVDMVVEG